ncbi:MAG TPA: glycine oxidase ThiO [Pyrinomonadaceae bacterium]|nr:glycine oxidase ThiO [Pyrinomonadaceae bacterium]
MNSDVLIIGGGVIGLAIARELHKKGVRKITILERGAVGKEASHAAAGMLAPHAETDKLDDFFFFCDESNKLYPNFAAELLDETGVDIELDREGTLYLAFTETDVEEIRNRFEWQKGAGLQVAHLSAQETRQAEPFVSPDVLESLFFPNDWQVENRRLVHALQKFAELNEIEVRENTEVTRLLIENHQITGAETEAEKFFAGKVILATGAWTSFLKAGNLALPPVKPVRGQMIAFHTAKRLFQKVIYSPRGYLVPRFDGRVLAGATVEDAGFDKSVSEAGIEFLRENALEIAPSLVNLEVAEKWAGLRPFAADALPILGSFPPVENLFLATAHYRNGILLAPLTAKVLAEKMVENKDSNYLTVFSPNRFAPNGLRSLNISV